MLTLILFQRNLLLFLLFSVICLDNTHLCKPIHGCQSVRVDWWSSKWIFIKNAASMCMFILQLHGQLLCSCIYTIKSKHSLWAFFFFYQMLHRNIFYCYIIQNASHPVCIFMNHKKECVLLEVLCSIQKEKCIYYISIFWNIRGTRKYYILISSIFLFYFDHHCADVNL